MFLSKEKSSLIRSSSVKSIDRKRSLIRIPSTSKIPKDFFRQPAHVNKSSASTSSSSHPNPL